MEGRRAFTPHFPPKAGIQPGAYAGLGETVTRPRRRAAEVAHQLSTYRDDTPH